MTANQHVHHGFSRESGARGNHFDQQSCRGLVLTLQVAPVAATGDDHAARSASLPAGA